MGGMTEDLSGAVDSKGPEGDGSARGCLFGCLGLIAAFLLFVFVSCGISMSGAGDDDWEPTSGEAAQICEDWVSEKLKAPSTAKFSGERQSSTGADSWTITGAVDAQNGFGAMIRSAWTCDVRWDASTDRWRGSAVLLE